MRTIWAQAEPVMATGQLHGSLQKLIDVGLVAVDGGLFFAALRRTGHRVADIHDLTGEEAGVNKLYLDDIVDTDIDGWAAYCVGQGVLLGRAVVEAAARFTRRPIDVLISADFGAPIQVGDQVLDSCPSSTFRFYCRRVDNS